MSIRPPFGKTTLERALSKRGVLSRTQARQAILAGRVLVAGIVCTDPQLWVIPESLQLTVDGVAIEPRPFRALALHKPAGVVTTRADERQRQTVFDLLPKPCHDLHAVGRLDLDTSGLLLLTNDTRLSAWLTDPKNNVPRLYRVDVAGEITTETLQQLTLGIDDRGEILRATRATILHLSKDCSTLALELREGKNREVRRLLDALGHPVRKLHRESFGPITLGNLLPGEFRWLTDLEVRQHFPTADRQKNLLRSPVDSP